MKKIFLFLFCGLFLFSLVGCGSNKKNNNNTDDKKQETDTGGEGQDKKSQINLPEEFEISYNLSVTFNGETETTTMRYLICKDGVEMNIAGAQILYLFVGDKAILCNYDEDLETYVPGGVFGTKEEAKELFLSTLPFEDMGNDGGLKKSGTKSFLGRTCDYYVSQETSSSTTRSEAYRDQVTNICLKYTVTGTNLSGTGSTEYVATVFKTNNVTLPAHPAVAKSITNAFISDAFDGSTPVEQVYVDTYYLIGVVYDTPNAVGAYTASCENSECEITTMSSGTFVQFNAAGTYTIKLSGCGADFTFNVVVED